MLLMRRSGRAAGAASCNCCSGRADFRQRSGGRAGAGPRASLPTAWVPSLFGSQCRLSAPAPGPCLGADIGRSGGGVFSGRGGEFSGKGDATEAEMRYIITAPVCGATIEADLSGSAFFVPYRKRCEYPDNTRGFLLGLTDCFHRLKYLLMQRPGI